MQMEVRMTRHAFDGVGGCSRARATEPQRLAPAHGIAESYRMRRDTRVRGSPGPQSMFEALTNSGEVHSARSFELRPSLCRSACKCRALWIRKPILDTLLLLRSRPSGSACIAAYLVPQGQHTRHKQLDVPCAERDVGIAQSTRHARHIELGKAPAISLATNPKPILNSDAFLTSFARCSSHRVRATLDARYGSRDTSFNANSRRLYFVAIRSTNEGSNSVDNPFDDDQGTFRVLINELQQRSLWPAHLEVPDGWTVEYPDCSRRQCLDYIEQNWTARS